MLINVPQYIDIEDKVAGPLTVKQLGWMIAMGMVLFITYNALPRVFFVILAIPVVLFFVAMAFFRPYGQPMHKLLGGGIIFLFKPKVFVWKRTGQNGIAQVERAPVQKSNQGADGKKQLTPEQLSGLAQILDTSGQNYNQSVVGILKKDQTKKK